MIGAATSGVRTGPAACSEKGDRQFNFACAGGGAFFFTAFRNDSATDPSLWLVGLDAATGEPVLERQRKAPAAGLSPNFVDLAYFGGA